MPQEQTKLHQTILYRTYSHKKKKKTPAVDLYDLKGFFF